MKTIRAWLWLIRNGQERIDSAWARIEELKKANEKLRKDLLTIQTTYPHSEDLVRIDAQLQSIRRIILSRTEDKQPAPKMARNWREVQDFLSQEETNAAAS